MATREMLAATEPDDPPRRTRLADADPAAFPGLIAQHQARIAGLAYRLLGWRTGIEDVVQDVFVTALEYLPRFRGDCRLETWLYRLTVSRCRRERRRQFLRLRLWRTACDEAQPVAADPPPGQAAATRERAAQVRAAVRRLSQRDREVIVLRYLEDLPVDEISRILGLKRNAVEVRLSRARNRLRQSLGDWKED